MLDVQEPGVLEGDGGARGERFQQTTVFFVELVDAEL